MKVRLAVHKFPEPRPADMAALRRETVTQRDHREILTRWERRVANRVMARIARTLGLGRKLRAVK